MFLLKTLLCLLSFTWAQELSSSVEPRMAVRKLSSKSSCAPRVMWQRHSLYTTVGWTNTVLDVYAVCVHYTVFLNVKYIHQLSSCSDLVVWLCMCLDLLV